MTIRPQELTRMAAGTTPLKAICHGTRRIWPVEETAYLYTDPAQLTLGQSTGSGNVAVRSNTDWQAAIE